MIKERIEEHLSVIRDLQKDQQIQSMLEHIVEMMSRAFKNGKRVFFCGNGGSAADAQHLAAELSGRFFIDRRPLNAEALHVNSSFMTAISNDFGFEYVFSRQLEAKGSANDILLAMSTSGNSPNILHVLHKAKELAIQTIGFTGSKSSKMDELCDILIKVPSENTPRIQESHILMGHIICELVEQNLFNS